MSILRIFACAILCAITVGSNVTTIKSIKVKQGDSYQFRCNLSQSNLDDLHTFERDDTVISINQKLYKGSEKYFNVSLNKQTKEYILTMKNAQKNLSGIYTCGRFEEIVNLAQFNICVLVPPSMPSIVSSSHSLQIGDNVKLKCVFHEPGNPPATVKWLRQLVNHSITKISEESSIQLALTTRDHDSILKCAVSNEATKDLLYSNSYVLNVEFCPVIGIQINGMTVMSSFNVLVGEWLRISCIANSNPPITFLAWKRAGDVITQKEHLVISNVSSMESGEYLCLAQNRKCQREKSVNLNVVYAPIVRIVNKSNRPIIVNQSDNLVLNCCVVSNPAHSQVSWLLDNVPFSNVSVKADSGIEKCSHLSLYPVTEADAGRYTCRASNVVYGLFNEFTNEVLTRSDSVTVLVQIPPSYEVKNELNLISAAIGLPSTIACTMKGFPIPVVSWVKGDHRFSSTTCRTIFPKVVKCTLRVNQVKLSDYGVYKCFGRNELGMAETSFELTAKVAPGKPKNLSVIHVGHSWAYVCWTPNNELEKDESYVVDVVSPHWQVRTRDKCMNLTGLTDSNDYKVKVLALNQVGKSPWTVEMEIKTKVYPLKYKDLPRVINANIKRDLKQMIFDLTPFPTTLISAKQMCLKLFVSRDLQKYDKIQECLQVREGYFVSLRYIDLTKVKEIRASVCSVEKQSLCGPLTHIDLDNRNNPHLHSIIVMGMIAMIILIFVLVILIRLLYRRLTRKSDASRRNTLKISNATLPHQPQGLVQRNRRNDINLCTIVERSNDKDDSVTIALKQHRESCPIITSEIIL